MKENIHPNYKVVDVVCACGAQFRAGTTRKVDVLKVDICNQCHPFYTGKQKIVDSGGRVDKFRKRYGINQIKKIMEGCSFYCTSFLYNTEYTFEIYCDKF